MGKQAIPVKRIDLNTGKIKTYNSMCEAARENYTEATSISKAVRGVYKQFLGYKWVKV